MCRTGFIWLGDTRIFRKNCKCMVWICNFGESHKVCHISTKPWKKLPHLGHGCRRQVVLACTSTSGNFFVDVLVIFVRVHATPLDVALKSLQYQPISASLRPNVRELAEVRLGELRSSMIWYIEQLLGSGQFRGLLREANIDSTCCREAESMLPTHDYGYRLNFEANIIDRSIHVDEEDLKIALAHSHNLKVRGASRKRASAAKISQSMYLRKRAQIFFHHWRMAWFRGRASHSPWHNSEDLVDCMVITKEISEFFGTENLPGQWLLFEYHDSTDNKR